MVPCIPCTAAAGEIFAALPALLILVLLLFVGVRAFLAGAGDDTKVVEAGCGDVKCIEV
jgi:hypothetical protein